MAYESFRSQTETKGAYRGPYGALIVVPYGTLGGGRGDGFAFKKVNFFFEDRQTVRPSRLVIDASYQSLTNQEMFEHAI